MTSEPPFLAQLCYWGSDDEIAVHDHSTVQVVARTPRGYFVLLGAEEREVFLSNEDADLITEEPYRHAAVEE